MSIVPTGSKIVMCPYCCTCFAFYERCYSYCTDTSTNEMAQKEDCPRCGRLMMVRFRYDLRVLGIEKVDG